jgi:hypothetical protein
LLSFFAQADVVKPALVEISIFNNQTLEIEINLSLEAAISGIGTQYKNTIDAPNADFYDELRGLEPSFLRTRFKDFEAEFLNSFRLKINGKIQKLNLIDVKIDIVGYAKRPRKTVLIYKLKLSERVKTLAWQYGKINGDSALRWQIYQPNKYNWSAWQWLRDGKSSGVIDINQPVSQSQTQRFLQFISIGFDHVIPLGFDHILFIIGMALSSLLWRRLLLLVSSFTLAHTLTLGLAMYGVVEISPRLIEPLIAFSIAYIAIENLIKNQSIRRKSLIVFIFGLVHGLGFASMLKAFEMRPETLFSTLIGFNIGVELAQIALVLGVVLLLVLLKKLRLNYQKIAIFPASVVIAILGIWWGIERIIA